jgi:hypothetical protein
VPRPPAQLLVTGTLYARYAYELRSISDQPAAALQVKVRPLRVLRVLRR